MAAVAGVNEGSPQEPVNPALTQAEPAAGALLEAEPTEAGGPETEPVSARAAEVEHAEAEVTEKEPAEDEGGAAAEPGAAEPGEAGVADAELGEARLEEAGLEEARLKERRPARDMSPLAVVGVIFGVIALVGVAVGVLAVVTHGFHRKTVVTVTYRPAAAFALRPGQCLDPGSSGLAFTLLACAKPHEAEVFARFALTGPSWPGSTTVQQEAGNGCADRLAGYLNPQLANAGLAQEYIYPDKSAWQAGVRTVVCEVSSPTGPLTGSVRNPG